MRLKLNQMKMVKLNGLLETLILKDMFFDDFVGGEPK